MKLYRYDIDSFDWDGILFHAKQSELWDIDNQSSIPFPNGKQQFIVENRRSGGFRRFRFDRKDGDYLQFKSEDGIPLRVYIDLTLI